LTASCWEIRDAALRKNRSSVERVTTLVAMKSRGWKRAQKMKTMESVALVMEAVECAPILDVRSACDLRQSRFGFMGDDCCECRCGSWVYPVAVV
jgi:hypothetical protein